MSLVQSVLWTLAYFDIFDFPLTSFEIWKYAWQPPKPTTLQDTLQVVDELIRGGRLATKDGFYFFPNRQNIVDVRKNAFQVSKQKQDSAKRLCHILRHIPHLRGIFICNRVAHGSADRQSDIDFFIIAERGYLWTVRFLTTAYVAMRGMRPGQGKKKDTFCLSFYVDTDTLGLKEFMLPNAAPLPDIHYIYWLTAFLPLYDEGIIHKFAHENQWVNEYVPHVELTTSAPMLVRVFRSPAKRLLELVLYWSRIGLLGEKLLRGLQYFLMPRPLRDAGAEEATNVVIADNILKLHINDRRELYRTKFIERLKQLGVWNE